MLTESVSLVKIDGVLLEFRLAADGVEVRKIGSTVASVLPYSKVWSAAMAERASELLAKRKERR